MMTKANTTNKMTCATCNVECQRFGKHRNGLRRFRCPKCHKTYTEAHAPALAGSYIPQDRIVLALRLLLEGNSIRSTQRITDLDQNTITKILIGAGEKCAALIGRLVVNVPVRDVELDEIWSFVGKKEGHKLPSEKNDATGDAYCFVAIERHSKLVLNFALGRRDQLTTDAFVEGLRIATAANPYQITADGFPAYPSAIDATLSDRVDFAQLIKVYRSAQEGEARYSPAEVASTEVVPVLGYPDRKRICTSIVERQNLTMRMQIRRFTRLTNGFSKKWENHWSALCLWFAYYNFCRIHRTIRVTPAMEAGISNHVWDIKELLA